MALSKFNLILFLLIIGHIEQVTSQCTSPYSYGDVTNFCYDYTKTSLSWSDAYNQCLNKNTNGILIQIFSMDQFNKLKTANIDNQSPFWIGANNFASFQDSKWHWLDGSIVDNSAIKWCPQSTYDTAIGTYCAAYDSTLECVTNYLCSTQLPAPCVATTNGVAKQAKITVYSQVSSSSACTNSYGGAYANWWTYSILLLNWFILFCFVLYIVNCFSITKRTVILTIILIILSFMMIISFAILWGTQYQDIIHLPLAVVIVGCIASVLLLINISIVISNRNQIQRWMVCLIIAIVTLIIECILMLALILCIAYCSAFISLASTSVDKDIIASLLASIIAAISILFYNGILFILVGNAAQDRVHPRRSNNPNNTDALTTAPAFVPRKEQINNSGTNPRKSIKPREQIERATSPVDERILNEFYADHPKDIHSYTLEGRQYVVFEGKSFNDIEIFRRDLTQSMSSQDPQRIREAINRANNSPHASALAPDIHQGESLINKL